MNTTTTTYQPLTRRQRAARQVAILSAYLDAPLTLSIWSPGDGCTRYQIDEIMNPEGGTRHLSRVLTIQELELSLQLTLEVQRQTQGDHDDAALSARIRAAFDR